MNTSQHHVNRIEFYCIAHGYWKATIVLKDIFSCAATQYVLLCVCVSVCCVFSVFDMKYLSL